MRYIYTIICLFAAVLAYGRSVTFVTKESTPLSDVKCIGYSASEDSIASWVSNSKGVIEIKTDGVNYIVASHPEYSDKIIFIKSQICTIECNKEFVIICKPLIYRNRNIER